jgi:hypothetical protein
MDGLGKRLGKPYLPDYLITHHLHLTLANAVSLHILNSLSAQQGPHGSWSSTIYSCLKDPLLYSSQSAKTDLLRGNTKKPLLHLKAGGS